ncbi:MAG: amidophosphoribosyltransferase [Thermoproteus sp.]
MCGIGAVWGDGAYERAGALARWLMHRGEEGVGFAYLSGGRVELGRPRDGADAVLVHTRYSTTGPYGVQIQPVLAKHRDFEVAVAFNGTVVNYRRLAPGASSDSEALAKRLAVLFWEYGPLDGLRALFDELVGAASLIALTPDGVVAARDPRGIRPLAFSTAAVASETVALGLDAEELAPGQALFYSKGSLKLADVSRGPERLCALEYVYFAHPASRLSGRGIWDVRRSLGRLLARGEGAEVDVVAYVPETARAAAIGYAEALGKPLVDAVVKNRYAGRIFIKPPGLRTADEAFRVVRDLVEGRRVALVDDSIIRGTNLRSIVLELKRAGAREVHVRIASPPVRWPCFFGMDFQNRKELIAANKNVEEIAAALGADSLRYLDFDLFSSALGPNVCYGCFTGVYPMKIDVEWAERELSRA